MKVAIVVQGRFHGFDLAKGLLARGHDVVVLTNYPRWAAARFGLPLGRVRSFVGHGIADRLVARLAPSRLRRWWEKAGHQSFGRWSARMLSREMWDVIHSWSGISEEILRAPVSRGALTLLMRGSAHIAVQRRLLDEEQVRTGVELDGPSDWMVARELREYLQADRIVVLSTFSAHTFADAGVPAPKVAVLPLGVDVGAFAPSRRTLADRLERVRSGQALTVLFVGTLSLQKGLADLAAAVGAVNPDRFRFLLVGQPLPESRALLASLESRVVIVGKVPQHRLPTLYAESDLFLLPTIQDGFAVVLAQAKAARLPIVTTPNSAGSDIVREGRDGWIVPIRDPGAIVSRLQWCDQNRTDLAVMIEGGPEARPPRSWADVAVDFERICEEGAGPARSALEMPA